MDLIGFKVISGNRVRCYVPVPDPTAIKLFPGSLHEEYNQQYAIAEVYLDGKPATYVVSRHGSQIEEYYRSLVKGPKFKVTSVPFSRTGKKSEHRILEIWFTTR